MEDCAHGFCDVSRVVHKRGWNRSDGTWNVTENMPTPRGLLHCPRQCHEDRRRKASRHSACGGAVRCRDEDEWFHLRSATLGGWWRIFFPRGFRALTTRGSSGTPNPKKVRWGEWSDKCLRTDLVNVHALPALPPLPTVPILRYSVLY